jgi:starch synthase
MRIGLLAAEMAPLVKAGGLGDVVAALSAELAERGHQVTVCLPAYGELDTSSLHESAEQRVLIPFEGVEREVRLRRGRIGRVELALVDDPLVATARLYRHESAGAEARAWALLGRVGADWLAPRCDALQVHDHHAALCVPMLDGRPRPATLLVVHNLAFQGVHGWEHLAGAGLRPERRGSLEWYGRANALKGAILGADAIVTVSPTYAREIRLAEQGCGLDPFLVERGDALSGILNGIDVDVWNPSSDPCLPANYSSSDLSGKCRCREALADEFELLDEPHRPLIGMVSRLTGQKGLDLLLPLLPEVASQAAVVLLGSGDADLERAFAAAASRHVGVRIGFDETLAHRIEAGADLFLMPSRFEPCGLNQMISMRYGTLPIVRRTGGLADTVVDADAEPDRGYGFVFESASSAELAGALHRALTAVRDGRAPELARRAMAVDVSWAASAARYETVMERLVADRRRN